MRESNGDIDNAVNRHTLGENCLGPGQGVPDELGIHDREQGNVHRPKGHDQV